MHDKVGHAIGVLRPRNYVDSAVSSGKKAEHPAGHPLVDDNLISPLRFILIVLV